MGVNFEIIFLAEAFDYLREIDSKHSKRIIFNIRKAQLKNDPELFKKLTGEIWEFRTLFNGLQYRMLAFWDKTDHPRTLVVSTHGFVKKTSKVPVNEILKAEARRKRYFQEKEK